MGQHRWKKIAFILCVVFLLIFTFWYGGNSQDLQGFSISDNYETGSQETTDQDKPVSEEDGTGENSESSGEEREENDNIFKQIVMHITRKNSSSDTSKNTQNNKKAQNNANRAADKSQKENKGKSTQKKSSDSSKKKTEQGNHNENDSDNSSAGPNTESNTADPNNPGSDTSESNSSTTENHASNTTTDTGTIKCTISISCAALLDNMDSLPAAKKKLVPADGILLKTTAVKVKEGSTVFDVLKQVAKANNIHLEYSFTPLYKSYYIEGIGNLYEFDGGELSGWMYSVNGEFPGSGCSSYKVKNGDEIKWVYTCNLGKDVGGYFEE